MSVHVIPDLFNESSGIDKHEPWHYMNTNVRFYLYNDTT